MKSLGTYRSRPLQKIQYSHFKSKGVIFLPYIGALILCQILDYLTTNTLSFIDTNISFGILGVMYLEDILALIINVLLIFCFVSVIISSEKHIQYTLLSTTVLITLGLVFNVGGLIYSLINQQVQAIFLLFDAALVYISNVLIFMVWYWIVDFNVQETRRKGIKPALSLIFPQNENAYSGYEDWHPSLVDFLFLSFNTSSTLGPTDVLILSHRAKILMMCQVTVSIIILIVLAARAIGILSA